MHQTKNTDTAKAFNLWGWDAKANADDHIKLDSAVKIQPQAVLQTELQTANYGKLQQILDWISVAHISPSGLPCPGFVTLAFDQATGRCWPTLTSANYMGCYNCLEADNFGRIATSIGLVTYTPFSTPLTEPNCGPQYLIGAASLLAGIAAWSATEMGYTLFDACRLSSSPDLLEYSLPDLANDMFYSQLIRKAWMGRINFRASMIEDHMDRLGLRTKMDALPSPDWTMSFEAFDYWPVPFWFTMAVKEKFYGKAITIINDKSRPVKPLDARTLNLSRGTMALQYGVRSQPTDYLCYTGVYDITQLQLAGTSATDLQVDWLVKHFDHMGWTSLLSCNSRIMFGALTTTRKPAAEASTFILPRMRAMMTTEGFDFSNTSSNGAAVYQEKFDNRTGERRKISS